MIRLFHVKPIAYSVDVDRAMFLRSLATLSASYGAHGDVYEWLADVHPLETAIVIGYGEGAAFAADLAALGGLNEHANSALLCVNAAGLTHPIASRVPPLLGGSRTPELPPGLQGAVVTDPNGDAAWRGNVRDLPPTWEHRVQTRGPTLDHLLDAMALVIRQIDKSRPAAYAREPIAKRFRILPPLEDAAAA